MNVLNDDELHTLAELVACLDPKVATNKHLHPKLSSIRAKLHFAGQTIISSMYNGVHYYRIARKVAPTSRE